MTKLFTCLVLLIFTQSLFAQVSNIRFDRISIDEGLSQSTVNTIIQDKKGFIWLGTQDGLNQYNGYNFIVFKHDSKDSTSLSDNYIRCLTEDKKGNIWIATDAGLNLYNRKKNTFYHYQHNLKNKFSISDDRVKTIFQDKKGTLWVGTEFGLNRCEIDTSSEEPKIKFFHYFNTEGNSLSDNFVNCIYEDFKENLWIGTEAGGLNRLNREKNEFVIYRNNPADARSICSNKIFVIYEDHQKDLWIGTGDGLNRYNRNAKNFEQVKKNGSINSLPNNIVRALWQDKSGHLWIGTEGGGLTKFIKSERKFISYQTSSSNPFSISNNNIFSILEDRAGTMWIGSNVGINKFDLIKQNFYTYQMSSGLSSNINSNMVWSIYEEENGNIWIGTDQGISCLHKQSNSFSNYDIFASFKSKAGAFNKSIFAITKYDNDNLILGGTEGAYVFNKSTYKLRKITGRNAKQNELNINRTYCIFKDASGNFWMGTKNGMLFYNPTEKNFIAFNNNLGNKNTISSDFVRVVYQTADKAIWAGTNGGGLNKLEFVNNEVKVTRYQFNPEDEFSINNNFIFSIFEAPDGVLWVGTFGGGLNKFDRKNNKFYHYTEANGLSNNAVYGVLPDKENNLWLSTNRGISKFNITTEKFTNYYESDGLQSNEFNTGACGKTKSGKLMFGGIAGFNLFSPEKIKTNSYAPQIAITDFLLFNKSLKVGAQSLLQKNISETKEIVLGYRDNVFSIEFAALHYSNPSKNQYAYMLEPLDEDWNYVGNNRSVAYTKLDPGNYIFKVKGSNSDGVWNSTPTELRITITPPFWKTWWFRIICFIILAISAYVWYQERINSIVQKKQELEKLVVERTKKIQTQNEELEYKSHLLEVEKDKVEKLLLNILPQETVDELKTKGKASARHYRMASVMFTDFKGFTQIAESIRPQDLVRELDSYFIKFDEIIAKYNIEKIKTIGDAYMAAGGLPIRNKSNPVDIVLAALEIQRYMMQLRTEREKNGEAFWELRVGIHTGELIAGVVGIKRFAYDVWGDTVNTANRMETTCEVGKVNISGATYAVAREFFVCNYRGKIEAKHKGEIDMYYAESIRPELSVDGLGIVPNEAFNDRAEHVLYSKINYKKAEHHIVKLLSDNLPEGLFYHGLHHTLDVCEAAERLAIMEGVVAEDLHLLKTAALFHDAGFTKEYVKNEPIGCEMARETLPQFGYSEKQIAEIEKIIMATQIPQRAETLLEKIMCDADLDYLGRDDFHPIADSLKKELISFNKITSDKQWDEIQVPFLMAHKYFTESAIKLRQAKKEIHIEQIKERLKNYG